MLAFSVTITPLKYVPKKRDMVYEWLISPLLHNTLHKVWIRLVTMAGYCK